MGKATVRVAEGILEGELVDNPRGGQYYSFKGIPYAEPPVGDLRFKAPQPLKPWQGVRKAMEFGPICHQFDILTKSVAENASEDCLYLNVYTPGLKPNRPLPVMVWIHGGAFKCGSGNNNLYSPNFLLKNDVILVTINYRLEVFGFLCLGTEDIPGNAGMKDQVAALRWVQKNISHFGGNPENVTIFGESAGGSSVSYHLISDMSKGLFKRAIAQSGTCLADWSLVKHSRERALVLAKKLGCYSEDDKELYDFFKKQPYEKLTNVTAPLTYAEATGEGIHIFFSIVDEKEFGDSERFFYGDAYDILRQRGIHEGVEVLTGYTADEGLVVLLGAKVENTITEANNFFEFCCPQLLKFNTTVQEKMEIGKQVRQRYLGKTIVSTETLIDFLKIFGNEAFVVPAIQMARFIAKKNKVYLYKFTCTSERNLLTIITGAQKYAPNRALVAHGDDLMYLFDVAQAQVFGMKAETLQLVENVTKLWTNFARYGNPTPDDSLGVRFPPYSLTEEEYLDIGNKFVLGTKPDDEVLQFYEAIYRKYQPQYLSP